MIRYPTAPVPTQQVLMAPLQKIISRVPACEQWIVFSNQVSNVIDSFSPGGLQNISKIARNMAKVFDYLYETYTQSIPSAEYLLTLSVSAREIADKTALLARVATGFGEITITQDAQGALSILDDWDFVQGYKTPTAPETLANTLMAVVTV